ncbi:hypothetical protein [Spiribacter roseus]|uniref:hypothetical protein n=1 Tax=Spiribacter roseus TaxID=1855875 RepID=UPI003999F4F0
MIGAVAEERIGDRQKHSLAFPANAIRRLLADAGLRLRDVAHVAIARDPSANRVAKAAYVATDPFKAAGAVMEHLGRNRRTQGTLEQLAEFCDEDPAQVRFALRRVDGRLFLRCLWGSCQHDDGALRGHACRDAGQGNAAA